MAGFLIRRLVNYLVLTVVATSLAYMLAASALDPRANYQGRNPPLPPAVIDARLDELNLNNKTPLMERYVTWASGVIHGDFGKTWQGESVNEDLKRRAGVTFRLIIIGLFFGSFLGVAVGAYAAVKQYGWFDRLSTMGSFFILSIPVFVLANVLILLGVWFNGVVGTQIVYVSGEYSAGFEGGFFASLLDRIQHLILPTLSLALPLIAVFSRYQRNMMLDVLGADFIRTAVAKGMTRRAALTKHALRTALIPAATYFAFTFGSLLVGATITEKIFGWHGLGEQLINSINTNDVNTVAAIAFLTALSVLFASLLSDLLTAALDPRVRVS
ncbi:ABC transporter permease [Nonomuraea soli]|uniref:Peptide/nickel transport system permease protein n=1 Tax=Nonomuraea soli TaxID=1032476 RepID=A0A7W0CT65_9ACTN|nr:ABC transporter permease [Nonomuraea soli]MBA2896748.1 peptide/nickel transport system permease protein [Nonomuraea soli]